MLCPRCGAPLTLLGHGQHGGLRFEAACSVFRCDVHGPIMLRREVAAGDPPPSSGRPGAGEVGVRVPSSPRPPTLAGAIALREPANDWDWSEG